MASGMQAMGFGSLGSAMSDLSGLMCDVVSNCFMVLLFILVVLVAILICLGQGRAYTGGADDEMLGGDYDPESDVYGGGFGDARLGIREPWFTKMLEGKKKVEGRLKRGAAATLKVGDSITIARSRPVGDTTEHPGARRYTTTVTRVTPYRSFAELVKKEGAAALFPGKKDDKEALEIYRQHSTEADEAEVVKGSADGHAVVAIEVAVLKEDEQAALKSFKPKMGTASHKKHAPADGQYSW